MDESKLQEFNAEVTMNQSKIIKEEPKKPMKTTAPISPMPSKLKEIELDSQAGSQLKLLSEQKK